MFFAYGEGVWLPQRQLIKLMYQFITSLDLSSKITVIGKFDHNSTLLIYILKKSDSFFHFFFAGMC